MSQYNPLWDYICKSEITSLQLSFDEIRQITGAEINHSFLQYKKELISYGWRVEKISLKAQTVSFTKLKGGDNV